MRRVIAIAIAGNLTQTTKMPCPSYGLPALTSCKVGARLAKIEGSICSKCYANGKGNYRFPAVKAAQQRRLESLTHPEWVDAMVALAGDGTYFRWHDSGDIQNAAHFDKIIEVCRRTKHTRHWLPTRERSVVAKWIRDNGPLPDNLVVRMSAVHFDQKIMPIKGTTTTSGSHKDGPPLGFECLAPSQGGACDDCRACWNKEIEHISYKRH